jgi:peroxiredoxin
MKRAGRASLRDGCASADGTAILNQRRVAAILVAAVIAIALAVAFHFFGRWRPASPLAAGDPMPDFDLAAIGFEGRVRRADLKGHPVVLGVLDTRWPEFLDAVEGLERLNRALRRRGLIVVGVFIDPDVQAARDFVASQPVTFTPAHDPDGQALRPGFGQPRASELVVIDVSGKVVARSTDVAAWRKPAFRQTIEPFVEPEKPGM